MFAYAFLGQVRTHTHERRCEYCMWGDVCMNRNQSNYVDHMNSYSWLVPGAFGMHTAEQLPVGVMATMMLHAKRQKKTARLDFVPYMPLERVRTLPPMEPLTTRLMDRVEDFYADLRDDDRSSSSSSSRSRRSRSRSRSSRGSKRSRVSSRSRGDAPVPNPMCAVPPPAVEWQDFCAKSASQDVCLRVYMIRACVSKGKSWKCIPPAPWSYDRDTFDWPSRRPTWHRCPTWHSSLHTWTPLEFFLREVRVRDSSVDKAFLSARHPLRWESHDPVHQNGNRVNNLDTSLEEH